MQQIASQEAIELTTLQLFYYEVYSLTYDGNTKEWFSFGSETSMVTNIEEPAKKQLQGFNVANFCAGTNPECSPLSCNHLAAETKVNSHCLFDCFDYAKQALEQGVFEHGEPDPTVFLQCTRLSSNVT